MDKSSKEVAEVLLDLCSSVAAAEPGDIDDHVFQSLVARLEEVGAFSASPNDDDELTLTITPLLVGITVPLRWLLRRACAESGASEEEVLFDLREYLAAIPGQ